MGFPDKVRIMVFSQQATVPVTLRNNWTGATRDTHTWVCLSNDSRSDLEAAMSTIGDHVIGSSGTPQFSAVFTTDVCNVQPTIQNVSYRGSPNRPYYHDSMLYSWRGQPRGWRVH